MRVSDSQRVLFVHVPKTGGATLDAMFDTEVPDARRISEMKRHSTYRDLVKADPVLEDYWSFGFVRNPWARMVSWWSMGVRMEERVEQGRASSVRKVETKPQIWGPLMAYNDDFSRFVLEGTREVARLQRPQVRWLMPSKRKHVDFIGRVENFVADGNVVRERLGLPALDAFPRRNPSSHGHYRDYYNDETRNRVAEVFAEDIDTFGYTY